MDKLYKLFMKLMVAIFMDYITEFVSAGPKNYAYKLDTLKQKCVVKGFKLNCSTKKLINFESIKDIVLDNRQRLIEVEQLKFSRDKENWLVKTSMIKKKYRFVYDKRFLLDDLTTLPFGFKNNFLIG